MTGNIVHYVVVDSKKTTSIIATMQSVTSLTFVKHCSDFTSIYNPILGNCYVFNSGWNESEPLRMSSHGGKQHGKPRSFIHSSRPLMRMHGKPFTLFRDSFFFNAAIQWLKCKIRGEGTLHSGLSP